MEFLLASSNSHKAEELNDLFKGSPLKIVPSQEKLEVVEDGLTFQENAYKKAKAYSEKFKKPTLADDSGLVIPARSDILGVESARYAPHLENYAEKNLYLLENIKSLSGDDRKAYFVCYLCFYISENEVYFFEGRVHGVIGEKPAGDDGFGYDPIFYPDGCDGKSMAQVAQWKMKNSHRSKACISAKQFFSNYGGKCD